MKMIKTAGKVLLTLAGMIGMAVLVKQNSDIKSESFDYSGYDYGDYDDTYDDYYWWNDWVEDGIIY